MSTVYVLYAQIRIPYYVVFDPLQQIRGQNEMNGALLRVWSNVSGRYTELTPHQGMSEVGQSICLEELGLGLTLWSGQFEEEVTRLWLRWCDRDGQIILTGAERADAERQRADAERQRADHLAERLRAMGVNPDEI